MEKCHLTYNMVQLGLEPRTKRLLIKCPYCCVTSIGQATPISSPLDQTFELEILTVTKNICWFWH
uniref:Uncharacterized protein n=1 Tax=Rhizophora mucronata TaxID=61149 RepID=A0A2P2IJS6_RHIMU